MNEAELLTAGGRTLEESERVALMSLFGPRCEAHVRSLARIPVVGASFRVDATDDESGLGAEVRILDPSQIVDEALHAYPGKAALTLDYLPLGMCLEGSGDPYFVHLPTGQIVRIPHDAVRGDKIATGSAEVVRQSIRELVEAAQRL